MAYKVYFSNKEAAELAKIELERNQQSDVFGPLFCSEEDAFYLVESERQPVSAAS